MSGTKKKNIDASKKTKTVGDVINEDIDWIITTSNDIFENKPDHPLWRKSHKAIAELFLVDHQMKIFKAEQVIKKVRGHFKEE